MDREGPVPRGPQVDRHRRPITSSGILWELDAHTLGKHGVLRAYLNAWLPIMAHSQALRGQKDLLLVDGFAGPGRYVGGEDGSPLIMLKAFLEHGQRASIERMTIRYVFIESHKGRFDHLVSELERLRPLPPNVVVLPIHGEYGDVMQTLLAERSDRMPTFAFLDPFGYADTELTLTSEILSFPRCEVLIYVPTRFIARFVTQPDVAHALDRLYGGSHWEEAKDVTGEVRIAVLRRLFSDAMGRHAEFVRSFEILTSSGGGYDLYFATNNEVGLKKMKEAMWTVDPVHGRAFRYEPERPQLELFSREPDTGPLRHALRVYFGLQSFTVADAERYVALSTDFIEDRHLKRGTLTPLENDGRLQVQRPAGSRKGSWPTHAILRFEW